MSDTKECFLCLNPSDNCCPDCLEPYCSEDHYVKHKGHNGKCFPFRAQYTPQVGRYLIATRDIEALEILLEDESAVFGPNHDTKPVCLECLEPLSPEVIESFLCPHGCGFPLCNERCVDGPNHKSECEVFRDLKTDFKMMVKYDRKNEKGEKLDIAPEYGCVTPLRLAMHKIKNPKLWDFLLTLMNHDTERRKEIKYWNMFKVNVVDFLRITCGLKNDFTEEDLFHCVGILRTNAFHLENHGPKSIGRAIFPIFSLLSHSCICNCRYSASGRSRKITVRAQVPINKGEELTIQYISFMYGNIKRRMDIKECWFFDCLCSRCQSPSEFDSFMSALKCKKCLGPSLPKNPLDCDSEWSCIECSEVTDSRTAKDICNKYEKALFETYENDVERYEKLIPEFSEDLYTSHYLILTAKKYLADLYGTTKGYLLHELSTKKINTKISYYEEFCDTINKVDPGLTKWKGNLLFKLYQVLYFRINRDASILNGNKKELIVALRKLESILNECLKCLVEEDEITINVRKSAMKAKNQLNEILFFSDFL